MANKKRHILRTILFIIGGLFLAFVMIAIFAPEEYRNTELVKAAEPVAEKPESDPRLEYRNMELVKAAEPVAEKPPEIDINSPFYQWWWLKYQALPPREGIYGKYNRLEGYDIATLLEYHRILSIERWNKQGFDRFDTIKKELAEKLNVHYEFLDEIDDYISLSYYDYLCGFTKEYFEKNNHGIKPDYYSVISNTAFLGSHTFDCHITLDVAKDEPEIQNEIEKKLVFLIQNLPEIIGGIRVFSVNYNNLQTGTSGSLNVGCIWKRSENKIFVMEEGLGTYGTSTSLESTHWQQDEWNNQKCLVNDYKIN